MTATTIPAPGSDIQGREAQAIAEAAVEFVQLRAKAAELKAQRAELLAEADCPSEIPCYHSGTSMIRWCLRCRRVQPVHVQYRSTVSGRTAALLRLKRLVRELERHRIG